MVLTHPITTFMIPLVSRFTSKTSSTSSSHTPINNVGILFAFNKDHALLTDIIAYLEKMYCSTLTLEASHLTVSILLSIEKYLLL